MIVSLDASGESLTPEFTRIHSAELRSAGRVRHPPLRVLWCLRGATVGKNLRSE
jgi:hypothetical protein